MCISPLIFNRKYMSVCSLWIFMEFNNFMRSKLRVLLKNFYFSLICPGGVQGKNFIMMTNSN